MLQLGKKIIIFDGGMGSEIERRGLSSAIPEELNILAPDVIKEIHQSYADSNADVITTNTFGLNCIKYKGRYTLNELADAAINNAKATGKCVFFDIGPLGELLKPIGTISFDEAYNAFKEVVVASNEKVDGYIAETFSDLYELKACILAIKENSTKPVFATMTFDATARTLTGTTPEIMVELLEGLGVDALGVNCSLGPEELSSVIERILAVAHIPVIIQPNRGLPKIKNEKTYYDLTVEDFTNSIERYVKAGVSVIGGCCGTTPEFIKSISKFKGMNITPICNPYKTTVTSYSQLVHIENVTVCGERLNPTGKKLIKAAIENGDYDYLVGEAIKQENAGAALLDLNVGVPKIDEPHVMRTACQKLQEYIDLPLQIDSSDKAAIEQGVRYYNGIPLINSVNGEKAVMEAVFPIAKKYGAVVLGLTLDENGIPKTAEKRFEIAKRIVEEAEKYGIKRNKIMIDTLVLTASTEQALVIETLKALSLVRTLGVKTALGVSNVSFGLPNRPLINKTFLTMAMQSGLNMPILNPNDSEMMNAVKAFNVLSGVDNGAEQYIKEFSEVKTIASENSSEKTLSEAIKKGLRAEAEKLAKYELETSSPLDVINNILIPSLGEVGDGFSSGKIYLPQLIASAEAAKEAFAVIAEKLPTLTVEKGSIVLATVKGDVHDIGKNIVKTVLQSYGYAVIDLGKDVTPEAVLEAVQNHSPLAVGLSALMTTTVVSMEKTIKLLRENNITAKIFVGGAVLTESIAKDIDADYYAKDALEFVKILEAL